MYVIGTNDYYIIPNPIYVDVSRHVFKEAYDFMWYDEVETELQQWLLDKFGRFQTHFNSLWGIQGAQGQVSFLLEDDAIEFKMRWGGV